MNAKKIVKALLDSDVDEPGDLSRLAFPPQYAHVLGDPNTPDFFIAEFYNGGHSEIDGDGNGTVPQQDNDQGWWATEYSKGYITDRKKLYAKYDFFNLSEEWETLELGEGSMPEVGSPQEKLIDFRLFVYEPAQQWMKYAEYVKQTGDDPLLKYHDRPRHGQTPELNTDMERECRERLAAANKAEREYAELKRATG